jgi:hypothetical protein
MGTQPTMGLAQMAATACFLPSLLQAAALEVTMVPTAAQVVLVAVAAQPEGRRQMVALLLHLGKEMSVETSQRIQARFLVVVAAALVQQDKRQAATPKPVMVGQVQHPR